MLVTETVARKKMCPYLAIRIPTKHACIASNCMAWHWFDEETAPPSAEWKKLEDEQRRGYCGLAGKEDV